MPKLWTAVVAVVVRDKQKSKRFFRDQVGMKVLADYGHWVTLGDKRRGAQLHVCSVRDWDKKHPYEKGNTGILILTDEPIEKAYKRMKSKGVKFTAPPKKEEWGWNCQFADPDGNQYWLMPSG